MPQRTPEEIVRSLLDLRAWQAFDIDEEGRVLAGHDDLGSLQLVEIGTDGTRTPLTALPSRCSGRYVPGRRQVVVEHDTGGDERMQLSLLDLDPLPAAPVGLDGLTPLLRDPESMHVLGDVTADHLVYSTNRRNKVDMDVIVRSLADGSEQVVHDYGGYVGAMAVSHDGGSVAITSLTLQPASTAVAVSGPRAADGPFGPGAVTDPEDHAQNHGVGWTADDTALVIDTNHDREYLAVVRVGLDGTDRQVLAADDGHDLTHWLAPDGSAMVIGTLDDGAETLAVHEVDGTHRLDVDLGRLGVPDVVWAADGSRFVVTLTTPTVPTSILAVDARTGAVTTLVDGAAQLDPDTAAALVEPTSHRVPTPDGEQVPCFVFRPAAPVPGVDGASVLLVHGGPEGASTRMFNPVVQALVGCGLTVLVPNVRGSVGYGKRWYSLDDVDLRLDSVADLAALHAWLPSIGLDPARSALWGGSYGGYMVLAGVTMQPELWAAGVDIVGISSLVTFLENTSGYRRAYREREYGRLDRDRELLVRASPITYLDQLRAPLFVIHGANDPRVPLSEAEQIVAALAERGIPHVLKVYDDEGHGLAKRANRLDAYPAAIRFLLDRLAG
ncbi:dipeptidyl aminopeptidase/acylaminoacyl peptidase [Friedmanniella endophytica]|uniref:Dipeptidyl aminopeptidase/acylaminoacyl peptidase n=1 Tax=Microlunatus kandeliicorticis TaxID=1759536 RepID=A0A7W3IRD6_9ACTN|nr:prolyl oligopeptidase family serine peptidase [Microlunatus kandeliicorticis]MBA8793805.1 dipeptidyl aminopeptidase/acylaminoacyl peptidase [Microlunatus kandeliicorticis]